MKWQDYIEENPNVCFGKPVFKGTRFPVAMLLKYRGGGMSEEEMLREFPTLRPEFFRAADIYAAAVIELDEILFPPKDRGAA